MFRWAIVFLVLALIAGALGFSLVAHLAFGIAKFLFFIFIAIFIILLVLGLTAARRLTGR